MRGVGVADSSKKGRQESMSLAGADRGYLENKEAEWEAQDAEG